MMMETRGALDQDATLPPQQTLRFKTPMDLYSAIPETSSFIKQKPEEGEDTVSFFKRLAASDTPEDAVAFTAFAAEMRDAVSWGLMSVQQVSPDLGPDDQHMLNWVSQWLSYPSNDLRWQAMQLAMFSPHRTPAVFLGLAVGWSGGPIAPNDPSTPPHWRGPRAVSAAVMTAICNTDMSARSVRMAQVLDLAKGVYHVSSSR